MPSDSEVLLLTLAGIAYRCAHETDRFYHREDYDPRYCFELFRRAILNRDARACDLLFNQYRPLMNSWVQRHPAFPASGEEAQYFVNRAFEKLWLALTPEKFERFLDLKSILRYLQMCVHSAIVDHVRLCGPHALSEDADETDDERSVGGNVWTAEDDVLIRTQREDFWRSISEKLNDDKERLAIYGSFALALKPRELCAQFPGTFTDVRDVYRTKANVLERLRRDPELAKYVGEVA